MKIIKEMCEYMEEEIHDAKKYIKKAIAVKSEHPALAEVFNRLSMEEMNHMSMLHTEAEKLIADYRREHGDPPVNMQAVYDYLHERMIDKAREVKEYQAIFRE